MVQNPHRRPVPGACLSIGRQGTRGGQLSCEGSASWQPSGPSTPRSLQVEGMEDFTRDCEFMAVSAAKPWTSEWTM